MTAVAAPATASAWALVAAGVYHSCGIAASNTPDAGKLFCWGERASERAGVRACKRDLG